MGHCNCLWHGCIRRHPRRFVGEYPRKDLILSTKFTPQIADAASTNSVEKMLNASLERLGTDYVDIYWIHNPADVELWTPGLIPCLKSGKAKVLAFPTTILQN